jgi:hypothetical protein
VYRNMELWSEVRRRVLVEGVSKRQVLRETGMHWRTLKMMLSEGVRRQLSAGCPDLSALPAAVLDRRSQHACPSHFTGWLTPCNGELERRARSQLVLPFALWCQNRAKRFASEGPRGTWELSIAAVKVTYRLPVRCGSIDRAARRL